MPVMTRQPGDLHINRALDAMSMAYVQEQTNFIADVVFPNIPSNKQSDIYWTWPKGTFFRTDVEPRSPGAEPPRSSWRPDKSNFLCDTHELAEDIFDEERANADSEFELDDTSVMHLTQQHLIYRELKFVSRFFKTGVWARDLAGVASGPTGNQFLRFDVVGSDPITLVQTEVIRMLENTGTEPNTLVISPWVKQVLKNHALILDRYKATGVATAMGVQGTAGIGDKVWLAILAELFGVARVIEAKAVWNSANEQNDSNPTMGFIFPKGMLLTYAAPNPGKKIPSAGYTFSWRGYLGGPAKGIRFIKARNDVRRADTIVAEQSFEQKVVASDLGVFFSAVTQ